MAAVPTEELQREELIKTVVAESGRTIAAVEDGLEFIERVIKQTREGVYILTDDDAKLMGFRVMASVMKKAQSSTPGSAHDAIECFFARSIVYDYVAGKDRTEKARITLAIGPLG